VSGSETEEKVREVVEAAWGRRSAPTWMPRLCPPLPLIWPPDGQGQLVTYACAFRGQPSIRHGEEIAAPWARVVVTAPGQLQLEDLGELRPLGVQIVRPLSARRSTSPAPRPTPRRSSSGWR
jgi:hypothetical protein